METNFFYEYIHDASTFEQFGASHWWAMIISTILIVIIPWWAKKYLTRRKQIILGNTIGWIIFFSIFSWIAIELAAGTFEIKEHLPFQICRFTNVIVILMLNFRRDFWFQVLYFWTVTAVLQASISPDVGQDFPHYYFFRFFIGHTGMMLAVVYAWVVYEMKPTMRGFWIGFLSMNVYMVFSIVLNLALGSNYFYTLAKPETASPLDYFGPWPWYMLVCEVLALAQGALFYVHLWLPELMRRIKRS